MEHSLIELLTYYVIVAALFIGAPAVFFTIVFMPALMNTKGAVVGYKIHRDYGDTWFCHCRWHLHHYWADCARNFLITLNISSLCL